MSPILDVILSASPLILLHTVRGSKGELVDPIHYKDPALELNMTRNTEDKSVLSTSLTPLEKSSSDKKAGCENPLISYSPASSVLYLPQETETNSGSRLGPESSIKKKQKRTILNSSFCHLCTRKSSQKLRTVGCKNAFRIPRCKKSICENCFKKHSSVLGTFQESLKDLKWMCTHCQGNCPEIAQCSTYGRVNNDRLKIKLLERAKVQSGTLVQASGCM